MNAVRELIIPADAAEKRELAAEGKSQLLFFILFGGGCSLAAVITAWPFSRIDSFRLMALGVLCSFSGVFAVLFVYQSWRLHRNFSNAKSRMYVGYVTKKDKTNAMNCKIWIGDRAFEVTEFIVDEVKIGDYLAVREWMGSGDYIEHTLDKKRIEALERRALNT